MRTRPHLAALLGLLAVLPACGSILDAGTGGPIPEAEVRALFIGNSLTSRNDLPGMVASIADAAGRTFEYRVVARNGWALEDHWYAGVESDIREAAADVVVMQQGPSSTPPNQQHLRSWAVQLSGPIEEAGGVPALFMVWPEAARAGAFDAVLTSYRNAALAVEGLFIPAGEAWRKVWESDPDAALYGADDFHPSREGTFVAALAVYAVLFGEDPRDLPAGAVAGVSEARVAAYAAAVQVAVEETAVEPSQIIPRTPQR